MGDTVYQEWRANRHRQRTPRLQRAPADRRRSARQRSRLRLGLHAVSAARRRALHRHRLRRPIRRLSLSLRQLRLVRAERRSALRLSAGDGARSRPRGRAHGRHRRAALRLRGIRARDQLLSRSRKAQSRAIPALRRSNFTPAQAAAAQFATAADRVRISCNWRPPQISPSSMPPCARRRPPCFPLRACPIVPGTSTPSTPPANTRATQRSSFRGSTRPSTPRTQPSSSQQLNSSDPGPRSRRANP